ncbi:MAG: twitching motility protein PilT [Acidobacteria bacterium]|nr:MAG: twitching motility protein PilT [Acidobacteriota bacterium]
MKRGDHRGLTLDAGALIAIDRNDRNDRNIMALLKDFVERGVVPTIPAPVVAQAWRSSRQSNLARFIKLCRVEPTDLELARLAGELCRSADVADAIDAIVVASAARRGDLVATSDARHFRRMAAHVEGVVILNI